MHDVASLLRETVTVEVAFPPATTSWQKKMRAFRRAIGMERPRKWTFTFVESPVRHVVGYIRLTAALADNARKRTEGATDFSALLQQSAATVEEEATDLIKLFVHITGIDDTEFWDALPGRHRGAILEAYEKVNPALADAKKKLDLVIANLLVGTEKEVASWEQSVLSPLPTVLIPTESTTPGLSASSVST